MKKLKALSVPGLIVESEGTLSTSRVPSDKNWESGIEHWSDPPIYFCKPSSLTRTFDPCTVSRRQGLAAVGPQSGVAHILEYLAVSASLP